MPTYYQYDSQTSTYQPGLQYDGVTGITINGSPATSFFIPMILSTYNPPTLTQQLNTQPLIPIYSSNGMAYGGGVVQPSGPLFPKITLAGTIDTALTSVTETDPRSVYTGTDAEVPVVALNSIPAHWVTVLAAFFEGRIGITRHDPTYYRDPYGRQFNSPRVFDYTASYIAGVPERANFTMVLMPPKSAI